MFIVFQGVNHMHGVHSEIHVAIHTSCTHTPSCLPSPVYFWSDLKKNAWCKVNDLSSQDPSFLKFIYCDSSWTYILDGPGRFHVHEYMTLPSANIQVESAVCCPNSRSFGWASGIQNTRIDDYSVLANSNQCRWNIVAPTQHGWIWNGVISKARHTLLFWDGY